MQLNLDEVQQMEKSPLENFGLHLIENIQITLELLAVKHVITDYREMWKGWKHTRIWSVNIIAIVYINNMGGQSQIQERKHGLAV